MHIRQGDEHGGGLAGEHVALVGGDDGEVEAVLQLVEGGNTGAIGFERVFRGGLVYGDVPGHGVGEVAQGLLVGIEDFPIHRVCGVVGEVAGGRVAAFGGPVGQAVQADVGVVERGFLVLVGDGEAAFRGGGGGGGGRAQADGCEHECEHAAQRHDGAVFCRSVVHLCPLVVACHFFPLVGSSLVFLVRVLRMRTAGNRVRRVCWPFVT